MSVVTFSGSGLANSHADGSAIVEATLSGMAGYGIVTVTGRILVSITITPANPVLILGTVQQFTATGTFSDQSVQDITSSVTWASSDVGVVSITAGGLAAGVALGAATVSATLGSVTGNTTVKVQPATLSSLTIGPRNRKIAQFTSLQFYAAGFYTDGSIRYITAKVSWTSSNTGVATIASNGLVHGLSPGTTTITARLGSFSASTTLTVTNATIVSLSVTPVGETIPSGTRLSFIATGSFSDGSKQVISRDSKWTSDNPAVATLRVNIATAVGPGTANISATFQGVSGSAPLYVTTATITSISVTPATAVLAPTTFVNCVATATFSDGSTGVITNIVDWTSSAPSVASVAGGLVTPLTGGTTIITAQLGSISGNATITVDSSPLTSIHISPAAASIAQQAVAVFQAIGTFADGNTQDLTTFAQWTSTPPSVATINAGRATGVAPGTAIITALFGGQVGTATLSVSAATSIALVVSPAASDFKPGAFPQFTALADFGDGTTKDVTSKVTWTSSRANLAAVTPTGLATSTGARTTTMTAAVNIPNVTAVLRVH